MFLCTLICTPPLEKHGEKGTYGRVQLADVNREVVASSVTLNELRKKAAGRS